MTSRINSGQFTDSRRLRRDKRASKQIGMLIVQIASILLVTTIVYLYMTDANLFVNKAESIQGNALMTAKNGLVIKDVSTMSVDDNNRDAEALVMTIEQAAGSDPINLENTLVYIQIGNRTARLNIRNGTLTRDLDKGFYTN